jgi:hypothetical protein
VLRHLPQLLQPQQLPQLHLAVHRLPELRLQQQPPQRQQVHLLEAQQPLQQP